MRLLSFIVFLSTLSPIAFAGEVKTRIWPDSGCALLLWTEWTIPVDPHEASDDDAPYFAPAEATAEGYIIHTEDYVASVSDELEQKFKEFQSAQSPNYVHLDSLRVKLSRGETLTLADFSMIDLLSEPSRERWEWLQRERGYRLDGLGLGDIFRLGQLAEFDTASVDREQHAILLNLLMGVDPWLESLSSPDLVDPHTEVVRRIAEAFISEHCVDEEGFPELNAIGFMNRHRHYVEHLNPDHSADVWHDDLFGQMWTFFVQRFAVVEALTFFEKMRSLGVPAHSEFYGHLCELPAPERIKLLQQHLSEKFGLNEELVEDLWDIELPLEWQIPPLP